jgi:energy-coupling factor transporter ATP-binding protein EcfA2
VRVTLTADTGSANFELRAMPSLVLIRGLPGSGKSTLAKSLTDFFHVEADMFFQRGDYYAFDPSKLDEAHRYCLDLVREALLAGRNVVVSNTFVKLSEMEPYKAFGAPVDVIEATGNFESVHNVPASVVDKMKAEWEQLPVNWKDGCRDH